VGILFLGFSLDLVIALFLIFCMGAGVGALTRVKRGNCTSADSVASCYSKKRHISEWDLKCRLFFAL
jgi:hypothetical protein